MENSMFLMYLFVGFIGFVMFALIGRFLISWWFELGDRAKNEKEIIALLKSIDKKLETTQHPEEK